MKRNLILFFVLFISVSALAQEPATRHRIAIFTPLYLDSAFDETNEYRYAKNIFPKFINPGLEFYEGVQLALDSLARENAPLEVFIYDTRSATQTLKQQLQKSEDDSVQMIIAYCSANELREFAEAGLKREIPVINVNLPNDGGVTNNPYFVLLNPTLKTQCEGIYRYVQKNYPLEEIVVFRKKGQLEDRIKMYFEEYSKNAMGTPLKFKYVDLVDSFTVSNLRTHLDTTSLTLCIAGSLDENFGKRLALQLAALKKQKYQSAVVGMPTWDGIKEFNKPEFKGLEIIYSTPFYNPRTDKVSVAITNHFNNVMYARPSDMVMRGYETAWKFSKILIANPTDPASNISSKQFNLFREFDIQPVLNRQQLDYFENRKLYFIKWLDGIMKASN